ncbi:MAG TPA: hypothetical protein VE650_05050, partial [Acetobacteraceae bacterium]|nr:hypothetical protein [Acetobacteraceae bacterium]
LAVGPISGVAAEGSVLRYRRGTEFEVVLNTGGAPAEINVDDGTVRADTRGDAPYPVAAGLLVLEPDQGLLISRAVPRREN